MSFGKETHHCLLYTVFDAMGKIPTGLMRGNFVELGSYEECLLVTATRPVNETIFIGQHCTLIIDIPWKIITNETSILEMYGSSSNLPLKFLKDPFVYDTIQGILGICIPSTCAVTDVRILGNNFLNYFSLPLKVSRVNCETRLQQALWTKTEICALSSFGVIFILVVIGTITDVALCSRKKALNDYQYQNGFLRTITAFSFYSNAKRLAAMNLSTLKCLDGIRIISQLWLILFHTFAIPVPRQISINRNVGDYIHASSDVIFAAVDNATLSVDTFFFLSGFLLTYTTWKEVETKKGNINLLKFLFHKYWRLTPPLCAAIALMLLLPMLSSGPLWKEITEFASKPCEKNWWRNLIYIQNFFPIEEICLPHTWYIACLMQYTVIGILLIMLTFWRSWLGMTVGFALISISTTLRIIFTEHYDLPPATLCTSHGESVMFRYWNFEMMKPHDHIGVYLVGMAVGYIVLKHKDAPIKRVYQILAWISSIILCVGVLFGANYFRLNRERGTLTAGVYSSIHRTVWALGIAWLVFACATGRAKIINAVLTWYPFSFLSPISYMAYLLHYHVIVYYTARRRTSVYFAYDDPAYRFIDHATIAFIISYFAHLIIEMPFSTLENVFLGKRRIRKHRASIDRKKTNTSEEIITISFKLQQEI